jgi:sugar phosphate isomerase/epimerase
MKQSFTRRSFLSSAGTTALGAAFLLPSVSCKSSSTSDERKSPSASDKRFTMGLSQYSLKELFRSGSLDPLDYPQFSVDNFGIDTIDFWEGGLPEDKLDDMAYLEKIRGRSEDAGTDIFLLMTGAVNGGAKDLKGNQNIVQAIKRAQAIGARYLRVFLWVPDKEVDVAAQGAAEALKPLSDIAAEHGVTLAIEPGASKHTQQGEFLVNVYGRLQHPNCTLMPDWGKLRGDIYAGTQAMLPHSEIISCKMGNFDESGNQPDFDYPRLMKMIVESDYRGILAIEWEGKILEPIPGVIASQKLIESSLRAAGA